MNTINFSKESLIFGKDSEFVLTALTNLQSIHLDYTIQISLFRISYDADSNQEFYLDLLNNDISNPVANTLRDLNLVVVSNADELRRVLSIAYETDYNFTDSRYSVCLYMLLLRCIYLFYPLGLSHM